MKDISAKVQFALSTLVGSDDFADRVAARMDNVQAVSFGLGGPTVGPKAGL